MLDILKRALRAQGVPVRNIEADEIHPQTWDAVDVDESPLSFGSGPYRRFYRTLFRWRLDDGSGGALLMMPVLRGRAGHVWQDHVAMAQALGKAILAHHRVTAGQSPPPVKGAQRGNQVFTSGYTARAGPSNTSGESR